MQTCMSALIFYFDPDSVYWNEIFPLFYLFRFYYCHVLQTHTQMERDKIHMENHAAFNVSTVFSGCALNFRKYN